MSVAPPAPRGTLRAMIEDWSRYRVLITGASSGIGAALARELAAAGAVVGICARRTEMLDAVLADCRASQPECRAWTIDLSELDSIDDFAVRAERELGAIDILVNNAALVSGGEGLSTPWTDIERITCVNYLSPIRLTRAVLPAMLARHAGHVVTISSMAARTSTPGEAAYAGSKAGLSAFFEALAGELWDSGVRFHLVYPALIDLTPGVDGDDELAVSSNGSVHIPAPVCARAIRRQLQRDDFELYVPETMERFVAGRARDVSAAVAFMADLYRQGALH
jgi:short-subunit dehydrogenase